MFSNEWLEKIWKDRYQKNGETYEENLRRVAKFCAHTAGEENEFFDIMNKGLFFPGGRTMSNSGIGSRLTLNNCFLAGTKVITKRGMMNIDDVQVGDEVIGADDNWHRVNQTMCRPYTGDLYRITANDAYDDIICTPNHQFLTASGWKRADRLLCRNFAPATDRLKIANFLFPKSYDIVDILDGYETDEKHRVVESEDNKVTTETYARNPKSKTAMSWGNYRVHHVNRYLTLTSEFRYFIGRWLGDGSVSAHYRRTSPSVLQIVFNATTEVDAADKCEEIGNKIFGFPCDRDETKQNVIALRWCNEILASWFEREFGKGCSGKHLSEKYVGDFEILKGLLDADGSIDTHGAGCLTLKNKGLIEWARNTLYLNGGNSSDVKPTSHEDTYTVRYSTTIGKGRVNKHLAKTYHDGRINNISQNTLYLDYTPINNIEILENQTEYVYNLSVEDEHSYTVNGVVVHNCFVAPQVPDDNTGIFESVKLGAITHQRGGGIGYDFSMLRPAGTPTSNDAIASGPVSFMDVFNAQTATILQGNRRGANMGVMNVYHPDIEKFVLAKSEDPNKLCHFNLSVMVDDCFMYDAEQRNTITLHWPVYDENGDIEIDPAKWKVTREVNAGDLWDLITRNAYDNGEPGIFFYDNMNRDNNLHYTEKIVCSNPCAEYLAGTVFNGELPANQYGGACNLGSLVLPNFVENPFTDRAAVNMTLLTSTIESAVKMLDNIIDSNTFPSTIYENYQKTFRTIGLGFTGLGDMIAMMGLAYNSEHGYELVDRLVEEITLAAYFTSVALAEKRGSFPGLDTEKFLESGFIQKHIKENDNGNRHRWILLCENIRRYGIRNAKLMSVAPTGTMSMVFGDNCSSGAEPIFSLSYNRKVRIGGQQEEDAKTITMMDHAYRIWSGLSEEIRDPEPPFVTALEMSVDEHLDMLGAIAKHIDMSVSKTINVPTDYPFEKTQDIYRKAWKKGIKGCTIFRPNEIRQGILSTDDEKKADTIMTTDGVRHELQRGDIISCDDHLRGIKRRLTTGCGTMHLQCWYDPITGDILETFAPKGSQGGCEKNLVAMTRLISACLRGGVPIEYVLDQLDSCGGCPAYRERRVTRHDTSPGSSCPTAIANALRDIQKEIQSEFSEEETDDYEEELAKEIVRPVMKAVSKENTCPDCGEPIVFEGGCNICKACGWSKCS